MLASMEDGEISISAYDTAWVALVDDVEGEGSGLPQFPSTLDWIANNQLLDGSWGDSESFTAHDRIINTIACVVALKSWNVHPDKCKKGMAYFKKNISNLGNENAKHMPIGFEIVFPSIIEVARSLNLEVPDDSPVLNEIYAMRNLKLKKIPREILHKVPTTLLYSLEGMADLDWEKLLKLQSQDGSFMMSPASTAYALMQTRDPNCLAYLAQVVHKFNGGVPNVYPVDLFEHVWAVDRLQRLGISRHFEPQLKQCIDYINRYWTEKGIGWVRNSEIRDIDDTSMGFRLLRLYGHQVYADVFKNFKKANEFICLAGQSTQAVTGTYNLFRASQVLFPGETILEEAKEFSTKFLREKQASNELIDKWVIMKDLPGEVEYALDVPWYASLPRLEARFYIQQYGGGDDVWIGKVLYRMPYVNNNLYLELAKLDYNNCQTLHLIEWDNIQKGYAECKLEDYGLSRRSLLLAYFVAAASTFEPERSNERLAWAKSTSLIETIGSHFKEETPEQRRAFVHEFRTTKMNTNKKRQGLIETLLATIHHFSMDAMAAHSQNISHPLRQAWENWLLKWQEKGDMHQDEAALLVETINQIAGISLSEGPLLSNDLDHNQLLKITNRVCNRLPCYQNQKHKVNKNGSYIVTTKEIESDMQQLVQMVLQKPLHGAESSTKQTFFIVARSFYYCAYSDPETINHHITKVLFERVI
nr:ent-copalyl diphosphate synthase, chloroplastic-like isoform X3 [Malus domestica]